MLAGKMRLNTFLLMVGVVLGGAVTAGGIWWATRPPPPPPPVIAEAPPPPVPVPAPVAPAPVAAAPDAPAMPDGAREVDTVVLFYADKAIGTDKLKDVTKGKAFKVNVYQDDGKATANRAKVDLDRDDKWDEKFTFDGGTITREVAPADDENYTEKYHWDGKGWVAG